MITIFINEECHPAEGKQTCSCFEAQLKLVNFLFCSKKMSQHIVFNLVFNEDSKMGSAIFCTFCNLKVIEKNNRKIQLLWGLVIIS